MKGEPYMSAYTTAKSIVLKQLRLFRRNVRTIQTALNKVDREAKRLTERKTLITPDDLVKLIALIDEYYRLSNVAETNVIDASEVAASQYFV